jgi:catechol 2,3-dioxygenase-like lactoylglutathione lyase family enzyme
MFQDAPLFAYIPAKDVARARKFYEDTLGFKPGREFAGGVWYEFAGGTSCYLYPTPNAGTSKASQMFWTVKNIEERVAELKRRGVTLEKYDLPGTDANGITTESGTKAAWFKDSEGNIMAIIQTL